MSKAHLTRVACLTSFVAFLATSSLLEYALYVPGWFHSALYPNTTGPARISYGNEDSRLLTADEVAWHVASAAAGDIPSALITCSGLFFLARHVGRRFGAGAASFLVGFPLGGIVGGIWGMFVYAITGGWGPAFLLQAIVAGLVMGAASPLLSDTRPQSYGSLVDSSGGRGV